MPLTNFFLSVVENLIVEFPNKYEAIKLLNKLKIDNIAEMK
jgi:hypothetical protein